MIRARATGGGPLNSVCHDLTRLCSVASASETCVSRRLPRVIQREASRPISDRRKNPDTTLELPSVEPFPGAASLAYVSDGHAME